MIVQPFTFSFIDYPDNESYSLSLYFIGCEHGCVGCHSPQLQNLNTFKGKYIKTSNILDIIHANNNIDAVCLMGGDPLFYSNIETTKQLCLKLKERVKICIYTGYDIEYVKKNNIKDFTYVKCGVYNHMLKQLPEKTDEYIQFASSNQKLYNSKYELLSSNGRFYFNVEE